MSPNQFNKMRIKTINVANYLAVAKDELSLKNRCSELLYECRDALKNHNIEFNMFETKSNKILINHVFMVLKLELRTNFTKRIKFKALCNNMRKEIIKELRGEIQE